MRVRYLIQLREPILIEDHWPVSIMGGDLRVVSKNGKATAFEVTFEGQSVDLAPTAEQHTEGPIKLSIKTRDTLLPLVKMQIEKAFAYLRCYFDVEVLIDEIEARYSAETADEESRIKIKGSKITNTKRPLPLAYDFLTRAIMAAEVGRAPDFEATLVSAARTAMLQEKYIDSFRYSFLLIESIFGEGKFKAAQLKEALKQSADFKSIVAAAVNEQLQLKRAQNSDTERLLASSPTVEGVIDHLVEKRGFYFHGNIKRKDAWKPHAQEGVEALCLLALQIAMLISQEAAGSMFDETLSQRHFNDAKRVGAIMTMNVKFRFREPDEKFDKNGSMNISVPGTRLTRKMALYVGQRFLEKFEHTAPTAGLLSATCGVKETGEKVFDMEFHGVAPLEIAKDGKLEGPPEN